MPAQGFKFLYDEDYNFQKLMRNSSKTLLDLVPAQSLWYTKMLYRKYLHEYFAQLVDPKGYRKREKVCVNALKTKGQTNITTLYTKAYRTFCLIKNKYH